ncbi:MAG TPA: DUF2268 domain-containing putative Zn-dependent protease [Bacteroidales bacterium]|jgi:hypothetical protein|nr:hypothetical protein [Bacteroidales bacterium]MDI9574766.1 DUF2268 domain-containing putative Zn-dependent protease [Bacteroidota bacterium]OQC61001.1 MAG: hypothetical protein BWX51_00667 [Bacteroidetes bacterium ADurb.Bin012]MBP9512654.1 hypothetical protein [Bacteroidales bacterium]MBP9589197.1 hypothetical protein [Bacteroidales bacterium]
MPKFLKIIVFLYCLLFGLQSFSQIKPAENSAFTVTTKDIDNFWVAFDMLKNCNSSLDSIYCLKEYLFDNGTDGFKEFIRIYDYTSEDYLEAIRNYPKFFNSVRANTLLTKEIYPEIIQLFQKIEKYYPNYIPLKICFVISPLRAGGTSTREFLFIGAEIITSSNKVDLSEFGLNALGKILDSDTNIDKRLIYVIAHETIHHLQVNARLDNYDLLNRSLFEGAADFIAWLLTGVRGNAYLYDYGISHEKELWMKFKKDIEAGVNTDNWMYNFDRVENDLPPDLGYFMGYRIVEAYFNKCLDKHQAVLDIIEMKNPEEFFKKSGYNPDS